MKEVLDRELLVPVATHCLDELSDYYFRVPIYSRVVSDHQVLCRRPGTARGGVRPAGAVVVRSADDASSFYGASLEAVGGERVRVLDVASFEVRVG